VKLRRPRPEAQARPMNALLLLVLLATSPVPPPAPDEAPPKDTATPPEPELEWVIPQQMLEALLVAAAPFDRVIHQDVSMLGMSRKVRLDLRLTRPRVQVTPAGIRVTFDYDLRGPAGLSSRGQATPRLELRALEGRGLLEGRLTGAKLAATGVEIPMEDLMDPVRIPASLEGPLELGTSRVLAALHAREVVLEEGRVRVRGGWSFQRAPPAAAVGDPQ
jgi:hypothetical protein